MRTEIELWEIVLSRKDLFDWGLCIWLRNCYDSMVIDIYEYNFLEKLLKSKRTSSDLYWIGQKDQIQSRIEWLENRIKEIRLNEKA